MTEEQEVQNLAVYDRILTTCIRRALETRQRDGDPKTVMDLNIKQHPTRTTI